MGKLFSMTGFASGKTTHNHTEISCELRSLNSRYLEIGVKLPPTLRELEEPLKERIRARVQRGKVHCVLNFSEQSPVLKGLQVDPGAVKFYRDLLEQIRQQAGITDSIQLEHLLQFSEIFTVEPEAGLDDSLKEAIFRLVDETLVALNQAREKEGQALRKDMEHRLETIERRVEKVGQLAGKNARQEFEKLKRRLYSMIDEKKVDANRLELELALIAERVDVTEEVVRLGSHIKLFREQLKKGSPVGKTLNFILQEMHREANTISNKSTMIEISHWIVEIKEEVEKIREQVQNIE
ncbi:MAG: YicC family protein [Calditrichaeota bacterium]|nr:MAG: YicC family protein [Calditrichota bacterium]